MTCSPDNTLHTIQHALYHLIMALEHLEEGRPSAARAMLKDARSDLFYAAKSLEPKVEAEAKGSPPEALSVMEPAPEWVRRARP